MPGPYPDEFPQCALRMLSKARPDRETDHATIKHVAGKLGVKPETLRLAYPAAGGAHPHAVQSVTSTGSTNQTGTYGYDPDGDTTTRPGQTLTYDPTGKLATVTAGTDTQSDVYDASGSLLLRTDSTGSTLFLGETELHQAAGSSDVSAVRTYMLAGKTIAERSTQPGGQRER